MARHFSVSIFVICLLEMVFWVSPFVTASPDADSKMASFLRENGKIFDKANVVQEVEENVEQLPEIQTPDESAGDQNTPFWTMTALSSLAALGSLGTSFSSRSNSESSRSSSTTSADEMSSTQKKKKKKKGFFERLSSTLNSFETPATPGAEASLCSGLGLVATFAGRGSNGKSISSLKKVATQLALRSSRTHMATRAWSNCSATFGSRQTVSRASSHLAAFSQQRYYSAVGQPRPSEVGIVAMEAYFPKTFVDQSDLEAFDGVSTGKYRIGLGQDAMAFCNDREDIYSMCLTAVQSLLEKYNLDPKDIGRLEVGTETLVDKSKAVKTVLMTLFEQSGNTNIEGIDTINACYGGTAALFNAINWVESSSWDGRYAIVVCGDIAVYEAGPARPTGGAGVVAMLVGPNSALPLEAGIRGSHMEHAYDFYKPNLSSEYPVVDGHLSINCYLRAIDNCYDVYSKKFEHHTGEKFTLDKADFALYHSPFTKMVQKSYARMLYNDFVRDPSRFPALGEFEGLTLEESYSHPVLNKTLSKMVKEDYTKRVEPSLLLPRYLGNTYTGSLYTGLLSLLTTQESKDLVDKRILMFSYGSGLAATQFSIRPRDAAQLEDIKAKTNIQSRLQEREQVDPESYCQVLALREKTHSAGDYVPQSPIDSMFPGTFYLDRVDDRKRRFYARK